MCSSFLHISSEPSFAARCLSISHTVSHHFFLGLSLHICRKNWALYWLQVLYSLDPWLRKERIFRGDTSLWERKWPCSGLEKSQGFCLHLRFLAKTTGTGYVEKEATGYPVRQLRIVLHFFLLSPVIHCHWCRCCQVHGNLHAKDIWGEAELFPRWLSDITVEASVLSRVYAM